MKYFEVVVQIRQESEDSKGNVKIKRIKETYLVDAMSVTEAEARVVKLFANFSQDFEVVQVKGSKILEVVSAETKAKPKPDPIKNSKELPEDKDDLSDVI
jgi:Domain of unknown function (DUF4494)